MRIGCQRHTHAEWAAFDEKAIRRMHAKALDFWKQWRCALLTMCAEHAKVTT
jgi:hypothetical protein